MESNNEKRPETSLQAFYATPIGKAVVISAGVVAIIGLAGIALNVGAYTVNAYKNFRDARKR